MREVTTGMSVKETQKWIAEKRKRINTMHIEELNEFNRELELIDKEWSSRWEVKGYRIFKNMFVWIGVALIALGGLSYHLMN